MKFVVIDCCPVPAKLGPELQAIKSAIGCTYASIYRGEAKNAQKYLTGAAPCYKHNQAWIFAHYPPGVANPPGRSTHELRSDGVAYAGPAGRPLFWWQCGIDVDDAHVAAFIAEARKRGWVVTITYPTSTVEHHHVNFRKKPMILDRITVLKKGDKGARVKRFTAKLANIPLPNHPDKTYLGEAHQEFDGKIEDAVKKFQGDHHLKTDGVVGPHTRTQIRVSWRQSRKGKKND